MVVAPDEETCARLRRAAGADVEVVAQALSRDEALAKVDEQKLDAIVIDGTVPDASALGETLGQAGLVVVMVGPGADVDAGERLADELPGAITRALIARRPR